MLHTHGQMGFRYVWARLRAVLLLILIAGAATSAPITWSFSNATFNDGGTATGYFVFDSDTNTVGNWEIAASAGSILSAFTYTPASSLIVVNPGGNCATPCFLFSSNATFPNGLAPPYNFNETRFLKLALATPLTGAGGTVDINLNVSSECLNCDPYRLFTQGSVQAVTSATVSVAPAELNFQIQQGFPSQSHSLQIAGTAGAAWQATAATSTGGGWLSVSPGSGQIPASLTVMANSGSLAAETYQGSISIQAPGATPSSTTINVTLTVTPATGQGAIITTAAGGGRNGGFFGDGGPATSAELYYPMGIALDSSGNLFIADSINNRIRKVSVGGIITTVAGDGPTCNLAAVITCGGFSGDGGTAISAALFNPASVAVDAAGDLFIADYGNNRIRMVSPSGVITSVAGSGAQGFSGDGGPATSASLHFPTGVAVDASGNLFIADEENNRIRKVAASTGIITTIAGNGVAAPYGSFSGDDGPATSAGLYYPMGIALDAHGNLFIADYYNNRIRMVSGNGIITTVAGSGAFGFTGDGGSATSAKLSEPSSVAVDSSGNLFIADTFNNRIRKVSAAGIITTLAGSGAFGTYNTGGFSGDGGPATSAELNLPGGVAVDTSGNIFIGDTFNNRIRKVTVSSQVSGAVHVTSVGNGASFSRSFAPGMLMSVFGTGLSSGSPQTVATAPLPVMSFSGTSVTINGISAPLLYISATQINLQIPYEVSPGAAVLIVTTGGQSASINFTVHAAGPGIFIDAQNGHIVPSESTAAGSAIAFFLTGAGQVTPSEATGNVPAAGTTPVPNLTLTMTVGGVPVTPVYVGIPDWSVGVLQINFMVPSTLASGTQPVVVTIGGVASQPALLTVTPARGNPNCTNVGGNWNASESGSASFSIVAPIESDSFTDPVSGSGSVTITQTGCSIQYEPIAESGLIGGNLTPSQIASLNRTGTVSGNNVTATGIVALVDTVAATQSGLTIDNISKNLLTASGQVAGNVMTLNETGDFEASGTYDINGQTGSFTLTVTTSSIATFDWASGVRPQYSAPRVRANIRSPYRENVAEPLRAALRKALIFGIR